MIPIVSPYLDFLEYTKGELFDEISELSEEQLRWRTDPNSLSIKEILLFLSDLEQMYLNHYSSTLTEDKPSIAFLDEQRTTREKNYLNQDIVSARNRLDELRGENLFLLRKVSARDWVRVALFTGKVQPLNKQLRPDTLTLAKLCEWHAKQMKKYLEQIRWIKARILEQT